MSFVDKDFTVKIAVPIQALLKPGNSVCSAVSKQLKRRYGIYSDVLFRKSKRL